MSAPTRPIPPRPWHTNLSLEAGVIYDADDEMVLVVDPFSDKTSDPKAHAIAQFVVDAVNRCHEAEVFLAEGAPTAADVACLDEEKAQEYVRLVRLRHASSRTLEAIGKLEPLGELVVDFCPKAKPLKRAFRKAQGSQGGAT